MNVLKMRDVRPKTVSPLNRLRVVYPRTLKVIVKIEFLNMTAKENEGTHIPQTDRLARHRFSREHSFNLQTKAYILRSPCFWADTTVEQEELN